MRCGPKDIDAVGKVMLHPEIKYSTTCDLSAEYGQEAIMALLESDAIVLMPNQGTVLVVHSTGGTVGVAHIHTVRPYRGEVAAKACVCAFDWLKEHTNYTDLVTYVPTKYLNVVRFCESIGAKTKFTIPSCYPKDGEVFDIVVFHRSL